MTPRKAIAEKCKDCTYDEFDTGTWIFQVEKCESVECSLHEFRPMTNATQTKLKAEKYQNMSVEEKEKADVLADIVRKRFSRK